MPYLHILNKHGPHNEVVETRHKDVVVAYRYYEGKVNEADEEDDFFFDTVLSKIYEMTVVGKAMILRRPDTGKIIIEAVLSSSPVIENVTRIYAQPSSISWEVLKWQDV